MDVQHHYTGGKNRMSPASVAAAHSHPVQATHYFRTSAVLCDQPQYRTLNTEEDCYLQ